MKSRFWICIMLAVLLVSCAHAGSKPAMTFNVAVPEGWKQIPTDDTMLFITKDGGYKQFVLIRERSLVEPFQFTKKTMRQGMIPEEAAEIIVNEIIADSNIRNFSLLENMPARIAGYSGFRLTFVYTDADGFVFKTLYYGFINGNTFYNLRYAATQEEYFQKDLKTFEKVFESFKLVTVKAS
ncbi:MAG: PsbP-related protein [Hyphomicrobiales bacterium]